MTMHEQDPQEALVSTRFLPTTLHQPQGQLTAAPVPVINAAIPSALADRLLFLDDRALKNGVHLVAGPGSGKSRLLGRILAWQMLVRRKPQIILDPTGGVWDNLIDKISRLPVAYRRQLWSRLRYVDAGATDFIVPMPLYYRLRQADTLFEIANRFLALIKRQDPQLEAAPILGWNSLYECGLYAGQIAAALEQQIDFVAALVTHPKQCKEQLKAALTAYPELRPAADYFREMMDPNNAQLRARRTGSFLNKLIPLLSDPPLLAAFSAHRPGVDWQAVVEQGKTIVIDLRNERDPDRRRFKLLYWFRHFIDFVKHRGMAGRGHEATFVIDEVTQLLGHRTLAGQSILAEDLEELVAVLGRNFGVNVVISHQNLSQVDERMCNVLMQMGTQIIGVTPNPDDAITVARYLVPYDPHFIKKQEPIWMNIEYQDKQTYTTYVGPRVIDYRNVEFTADEQALLAAQQLQRLPKFQFLVRPAVTEGNLTGRLRRISIANLDRNQYPDEARIAPVRRMLAKRDGIPLATLLAELQSQPGDEDTPQKPVKHKQPSAILGAKLIHAHDPSEASAAAATGSLALPVAGSTLDGETADEEEFWR